MSSEVPVIRPGLMIGSFGRPGCLICRDNGGHVHGELLRLRRAPARRPGPTAAEQFGPSIPGNVVPAFG
jgi:hypothetical protein